MGKSSVIDSYFSDCITVNRYIMRELGVNAALLYGAFLEQYASGKNDGKDITLRAIFDRLAADAHISLHDVIRAVETLERVGFVGMKGNKVSIYVARKAKGDNADE